VPSLSADGTMLAFRSNRSGAIDVWMKNLTTDETKPLTTTDRSENGIVIKADGTFVTFRVIEQRGTDSLRVSYAVNTADGHVQKLCEDCGAISDWSPSGNLLIGQADSAAAEEVGLERAVTLTELSTGQSRVLFGNQPDWRFSPDESWLAFHNSSLGAVGIRQVFVAPLPQEGEVEESQLIPITDGSDNSFRAAWSPNGELLYYASERDGYRCVYAQPLDPDTKQPSGSVREVYHSHDPRLSLGAVPNPGAIGLSVARDKIAFTIVEMTGDIWIMEPRDAE